MEFPSYLIYIILQHSIMEDSSLDSSINEVDERPKTDDFQPVVIESSPDHFPKTKAKVTKYIPKKQKITGTYEHWKSVSSLMVHPNVVNVKRSTIYEHIEFYQSKECDYEFRAACKLCRAPLTITRASGYLQHYTIKNDHGHNVVTTLV